VSYLVRKRCDKKGCHVEENRGQGVISNKRLEEMKWCGCIGEAAWPRGAKVQQSSTQSGEPESAAKEGDSRKEVRRTFKMLREVWLNIRMEKIDTHEDMMVKALLDSGVTEMFIDRRMAAKYGFKLQKLKKPIAVRNVDGTNNSEGAITHQVECNIYYKSYVKKVRINVCDLGKMKVILGMPWLAVHNPEIN